MLYATTEAELEVLLASPEPLVVGCYADWCPASSQAKPIFEHAASTHEALRFCKVRTDMNSGVAALLKVEVIPSFYLLEGRMIFSILRGAVSEMAFDRWLMDGVAKLGGGSQ